jgi:hypothetical protein
MFRRNISWVAQNEKVQRRAIGTSRGLMVQIIGIGTLIEHSASADL